MTSKACLSFSFLLSLAPLMAGERDLVVNKLLSAELRNAADDSLHAGWIYSNEGGVVKYAELDLIGDEKKEIIYDRTTHANLYKMGKDIPVYYLPENDGRPIHIKGKILLYGYHKKEGDRSIFLRASEGRNFDTPDEKAFTKKLTIQEVSIHGVKDTVHLIDENTSKEIYDLWKATLISHEKSSINFMKEKGYTYVTPEFKWVSVKDFVSGKYEWKNDDVNEWVSLNEFSREAQTWSVHKKLITPEYLEVSRRVRALQRKDREKIFILYKEINLPQGYLTPGKSRDLLMKKISADNVKAQGE